MILKQSQLFLLFIFVSNGLFSNPLYTLEQLIEMANQTNPVLDVIQAKDCLLYTSPSPRDGLLSRMPSSA